MGLPIEIWTTIVGFVLLKISIILMKIDNKLAVEYDKQIKDYIKAIRIKRD